MPENAVAVEHPSVVLGEQGGVVWRGGEPEGHGGMESRSTPAFAVIGRYIQHVRFLKKTADSYNKIEHRFRMRAWLDVLAPNSGPRGGRCTETTYALLTSYAVGLSWY